MFQPLEDVIREKLISAIVGRRISDKERRMLAMPVRFGGIGIMNPTTTALYEYETSIKITENLKEMIFNQERTLENYDEDEVKMIINQTKQEKDKRLSSEFESVEIEANEDLRRFLDLAREKSAGAWLTALPIQATGYVLNKEDFHGAICLRYGWRVPNTPMYCSCGKENDTDHALTCHLGGYVIMRHNRIRDLEATILNDVCKDVKIEPELQPDGARTINSSNASEKARSDAQVI